MLTPIYQLKSINKNRAFIKREDLLPFSFGGNKARKVKLFFKDISKNNNDVVVTYGSSSSNHCRVVANMAKTQGMKCVIISPEENFIETENSKLVRMLGADIVKTHIGSVAQTIENVLTELRKNNNPYFIQGGGHGNLGTQAYVEAYQEICKFEEANNIEFDYIFHASGTGTTQAGLVAGKLIAKRDNQRVIGISIARKNPRGKQVIVDSLNEFFGDDKDYSADVNFIDDYICGGYGKYDDDILETVKRVFETEGIPLNTTYTGKAFFGMEKYIERKNISDKNILFINTGGSPLFFDDLEELSK